MEEIEVKNGVVKDKPFITIGIINHNYGHYLPRCLDAIKRQKFLDYELIIADNDSDDDSCDIIRKYVDEEHRVPVTFVRGENVGHSGNLKRIFDRVKGEYLLFCDADDYMSPHCLEELAAKAKETEADMVAGAFRRVEDSGKVLFKMYYPKGMTIWTEEATHCKLYKMSTIKENNIDIDPEWLHPDSFFNYIFYKYNKKTEFVRKVIYSFCKHPGSSSAFKDGKPAFYNLKDFNEHMSFANNVFVSLPEDKKEALEYSLTRMYYFYILYQRPSKKVSDYIDNYKDYHELFLKYFPKYLSNKATKKLSGGYYARSSVTKIVWFLTTAERLHVIKPVLFAYWCIGHFWNTTQGV